MMFANSLDFSAIASRNCVNPGSRRSLISIAADTCMAVGKLTNKKIHYITCNLIYDIDVPNTHVSFED